MHPPLTLPALALVLATMGLATAHVVALAHDTAPPPHPFARAQLAREDRFVLEGDVVERLDAGNYRYLRVRTEDGDRWVVSLALTTPDAPRVRVTALGRAVDFRSERLSRRFDELLFAVVRSASQPAEPGEARP